MSNNARGAILGWVATRSVEDMCRSSWKFAKMSAEKSFSFIF